MGEKVQNGPTFREGDRESAEKLCARWRKIVDARESMVGTIKGSPNQRHDRVQRQLDTLDAALGRVEQSGLKGVDRALERAMDYRTYWAVEATVDLLTEHRAGRVSPQTLEEAAENCEVSVEKMMATILDQRVQGILEQGLGPQKAALNVVGLLRERSESFIFGICKKHRDNRALWQERAKVAKVAKVQLKKKK